MTKTTILILSCSSHEGIDQSDLKSHSAEELVKCHPIMTGGLHANEQIFIGETSLFDLGHEQIQAFLTVSKRKIFEYSLSLIIQKRCNMIAFCNPNL